MAYSIYGCDYFEYWDAECCYAEYCWLRIVVLKIVRLTIIMLSSVILSISMQRNIGVVLLTIIMLSIVIYHNCVLASPSTCKE